jgi:hypothetical protein
VRKRAILYISPVRYDSIELAVTHESSSEPSVVEGFNDDKPFDYPRGHIRHDSALDLKEDETQDLMGNFINKKRPTGSSFKTI